MERIWIDWVAPRITDRTPHPSPYLGSDDPNERALAKWCRQIKNKMKRGTLPEDQVKTIGELPGWSWGKKLDDEFQRKARRWSMWYHVHNRTPKMGKNSNEDEKSLHRWQSRIQQLHRNGKLPPYHFAVLNHMQGWVWKSDVPKTVSFSERVEQWGQFVSVYQRVPQITSSDPVEAGLGKWHKQVVGLKAKGKLAQDRIAALNNLPLWCWSTEDELFEIARRWARWVQVNEGVFPSPYSTTNPTEARLGAWAHETRDAILRGEFPAIIVEKLQKIQAFHNFLTQQV